MKKSIKPIILIFILLCPLIFISCEDDAILQPQNSDDCQGSYCNLALPGSSNYAALAINNPTIF